MIGIFTILGCIFTTLNVKAQNCDVDFPGTAARTFSGSCGGPTVNNLELGINFNLGDGDTFTFDLPVVNITGNLHIDVDGNGKIIIPAGVTVNVGGNVQLHNKNGQCTPSNPCTFEIVVNGIANFDKDLDNDLFTLIWSGTGTVTIDEKLKNKNDACMDCGPMGCPNIDVNPSDCRDDGTCSGGNFCTQINACSSDNIPPVITNCPSDRVVNISGSNCAEFVDWIPPNATDNCSLQSLNVSHPPGSSFPKGTTVVTYTAKDAAGNTRTCSFNVTVVDNKPPILSSCPANKTVTANASCQAVVTWGDPLYSDNCVGTTLSSTKPSGSIFNLGTTVVTYTAKDAAGNMATCSFNVTVVDSAPPILSGCPADKTVSADASCQAVVTWVAPLPSDNCSGTILSTTHPSGSTFNVGTTKVTYTATDAAGNAGTCSFNVTVVDNSPPVIVGCPSNQTADANASCEAVVTWSVPAVSGNCAGTTLSVDKPPGSVFALGTTRVTYTARTASGKTSTCFFDVVVKDKLPPTAGPMPTVRTTVGPDCRTNVMWTIPEAFDCNDVQLESTHQPGDEFNFGSTDVTYTLTDGLGNTSNQTFQVVVENPTPPVITGCPGDITIEADEFGFAVVSWPEPAAEVICGQLLLTGSHSPGHTFPTGVTEVVYTASDDLKNESFCRFKVTVSPPKIVVDIAKVVTPDGNGINDFLKIENIEKYKDNGIIIVDRWGGTIFKANGYDNEKNAWKGTSMSGGLAPTGTYFYTMSIRYGSQSIQHTGFIELIR